MKTTILAALLAGTTALPALAQDDLPIAAQMYTLRDYGTLEEQLQAVADAGITHIETFGMEENDLDAFAAALDEHGIEVISDHASIDRLRDDLDMVVEMNRALGNDTITVPYLAEEMRPTDAEGWTEFGEELAGYASELAEQDMRLAYHNHDFELVEYDGTTALEILFEAAGPDVLSELDLAWVARGGHDPAEMLTTLGDRVFAVHAKDNAPEGENEDQRGFAAVGEGVLDWDSILEAANEVGVEWYIIEHDQPADAAGQIATGAEYLREALPKAMSGS
ncbi:sugar phosphate isomerase/epimerase [Palleronia sp. LCG004]|uniref:sugar phosphate isomerase/epimerase family protein n=1 Tax=Palleronia sp. LCG004 TaxID=3079304 RepID=UPI002942C470|nr:sugar phosphate isomerase/epimerase [Palleronia sp. LCG004]WOI58182.1 sugar phosphate isomerase/epimerase [Palleronia sp. LCG004]